MLSSFADNRLLATIPADDRLLLAAHGRLVDLTMGEAVLTVGQDVQDSLFPLGPTMISLLVDLRQEDRSVEVASVGCEGAIGGIISCGHSPSFARGEVQVAGQALRVPMKIVEQAKSESGHVRNLFCRYSDYLLAQVMQSVACNAFHSIEQRAARWLLTAQDRAGDRLVLTQEALADLLGVQRTTVNAVARELQGEGLIAYRRGVIQVEDRPGLERRACECYAKVEGHFGLVIGTSGSGDR